LSPAQAPGKTPGIEVQQESRPALTPKGGKKIAVKSFRFTGNTAVAGASLSALVRDLEGRELDMAGLDEAAARISEYYRAQGYFVARAYLPEQDVSSGQLEIAVLEGRLGAVKIVRSDNARLSEEVARNVVVAAAPVGAPVYDKNVERGLLLLNDLPRVDVKSTLVPGASAGATDLLVEVSEGKPVSGSVDIDNFGNKYSGEFRVGASIAFASPLRLGDSLTVRAMSSAIGNVGAGDTTYGRVAYNLPVGSQGVKVGLAYADMRYKLGGTFEPLKAQGNSGVTTLNVAYPIIRSRSTNLYALGSYDEKLLIDSRLGTSWEDKRLNVFNVGLSGDSRDALGGGGLVAYGVNVTQGWLGFAGSTNIPASDINRDAQGAKTAGTFNKVTYNFSRLQRLSNDWSLYFSISGQEADRNLDSSEKFVLGGQGVRAYPQGEGAGDAGQLLNLEARYTMPTNVGALQLVGFLDAGNVTLHKTTWTGWQPTGLPNYANTYSLAGVGFGVNLLKDGDYSVRASLATRVGKNPGRDVLGKDSDGASSEVRAWVQATKQF
jgi:hemolysin activation/secretion protein